MKNNNIEEMEIMQANALMKEVEEMQDIIANRIEDIEEYLFEGLYSPAEGREWTEALEEYKAARRSITTIERRLWKNYGHLYNGQIFSLLIPEE